MQPQAKECQKVFTVRSGERQGVDLHQSLQRECGSAKYLCFHTVTLTLYFWFPRLWGISFCCFMPSSLGNLFQLSLEMNPFSGLSFLFHNLFFSSFFYPKFLTVSFAEQLAVFVYTLAFWIFTLVDLPRKQVQCRMVGWPTNSCAKIQPHVSIIHFFNPRLYHISELEFSCISNSTLNLNTGWGE